MYIYINCVQPFELVDDATTCLFGFSRNSLRVWQLVQEGFSQWTKKDFSIFKSACERHGRQAYEAIAQELESKSVEEVKRYSDAFWKLGPTRLNNWDGIEKQVRFICA